MLKTCLSFPVKQLVIVCNIIDSGLLNKAKVHLFEGQLNP